MDELLIKQNIAVETDCDRVVLRVARVSFPMPYADGFKIAAYLRLACKGSMRISGESIKDWRKRSELSYHPDVGEVSPERRTTLTERINWLIGVEGELVTMHFGNNIIKLHFSDALRVAAWIKLGAKKAKRWAGDTSKSMTSLARLSDAEENYKRGYN